MQVIPAKIEERFIKINTDLSGVITEIEAGTFALPAFTLNDSIYKTCPFLEFTLDAIPLKEHFPMDGMVIVSENKEFNVDVELFRDEKTVSVIIINRTSIYSYVKQLNQNRNEISIVKNQINRQNKELEELRKIADKANEEKSRFLAIMSHEVRNPLNSILGYANIIESDTDCPTVQSYIKLLLMAGNNLKVIVNDILDLSRIEAGKLELASEPTSIKETVELCVEDFKFQHKESTVQLYYSISDQIPDKVIGDSVRITQILSNLLNNAFKFTEEGSITVDVEVVSENHENAVVNFSIKDTGRGMTADQAAKIFNEYEQNELDDNRVYGGAGLGLSIVNRLTDAMNGKISVKSELNVGSNFLVEIPFQKTTKVDSVVTEEHKTGEQDVDLDGTKILFADDDVLSHLIVGHLLSKEGIDVTIIKDGLEALSELKSKKYDVVLLDINMPNMSGDEVMRQKESFAELNSDTPILALTANASKEDVTRYLNLDFISVVPKPYTPEELVNSIKFALKK